MIKGFVQTVFVMLASSLSMPAFAASILLELDPASAPVIQGQPFSVRLILDAADTVANPGGSGEVPASVSGSVRIEFNSTLATYSGFTINPAITQKACGLFCQGNVTTPGADNRISISFSNAAFADSSAPPLEIGTFDFSAVSGTGGGTFDITMLDAFALADGTPAGSSFVNNEPSFEPFTPTPFPTPFETSVTIAAAPIPVPAAAWLFASALGLIGLRARRRA